MNIHYAIKNISRYGRRLVYPGLTAVITIINASALIVANNSLYPNCVPFANRAKKKRETQRKREKGSVCTEIQFNKDDSGEDVKVQNSQVRRLSGESFRTPWYSRASPPRETERGDVNG